MEGIKGKYWWT